MVDAGYCRTTAAHSGWMNRKVHEAAPRLPDEVRKADRGAFFRSIHATLDPLLRGERACRPRFDGSSDAVGAIGVDRHDAFDDLNDARRAKAVQ